MLADELCLDDSQDVRKALVVQDVVNILPIVFT